MSQSTDVTDRPGSEAEEHSREERPSQGRGSAEPASDSEGAVEHRVIHATAAWRLESLEAVSGGDGGLSGVAELRFDLPGEKVNKLNTPALVELGEMLDRIRGDASIRAVLLTSGKAGSGVFIAGADIHEIESVTDPRQASEAAGRAHEIFGRIAALPQNVIAVVDGKCLGGGTELALACDLRVASDHERTAIGLPEVNLGIIPGFGGTQRLPRLIGIQPALGMILAGKPVDARKACRLGLVDRIAPAPLLRRAALELAREAISRGEKGRRGLVRERRRSLVTRALEGTRWGRGLIRRLAARGVLARTKGHYPAPLRALDAVIDGFAKPLEEGLRLERELVGELVASPISKNLIRVFLASEKLRRGERRSEEAGEGGEEAAGAGEEHGTGRRPPVEVPPRRIGVLGAGVMGGGIAALLARKGFHVRLKDINAGSVTTAYREAARSFRTLVSRRRMSRGDAENAIAAISATTASQATGFRDVELVIEAIIEDMEAKRGVLRQVEPLLREDAVFATNTSSLSIDELAEAAGDPGRVAGLHFFNPVHRMPLVEIVVGSRSAEKTVESLEEFSRSIGKYPLRVKNGPGFLVNRLLTPYLNEAGYLFEEGYSMVAIDRAAEAFGLPVGPFALMDEVGFDVALKVGRYLHERLGDRVAPSPLLARLVEEEKLLGKKGGAGFYTYAKGRRKGRNRRVLRLGGRGTLPDSPERWIQRMLLPMVNEAARCLAEKIVDEAWQVDIAMIMGTGFPPFRGGPLRWADSIGLERVRADLEELAATTGATGGARFKPCAFLDDLASGGGSFHGAAAGARTGGAPGEGDRGGGAGEPGSGDAGASERSEPSASGVA